jgi:hypothetical protein
MIGCPLGAAYFFDVFAGNLLVCDEKVIKMSYNSTN